MRTSLKAIAAVTGALIALTACGGGDDDGAANPERTVTTDVTSPEDGTPSPTRPKNQPSTTTRPKNQPSTTTRPKNQPPATTTATATTTTTTEPPATTTATSTPKTGSPPPPTGQGSPATPATAAARLQQWIRAYGSGDAATYCQIAGPWFERNGLPRDKCPGMFSTFRTEPAEELASIAKATVDARQATEVAPGKVEIPVAAIAYPTPISGGPPHGVVVMTHDGTDWYVVEAPDT